MLAPVGSRVSADGTSLPARTYRANGKLHLAHVGVGGRGIDWGDKGAKKWAGCLIVGTEGKIYATAHNATFTMLPEEKFKDLQKNAPQKVDRSQGHERDWLNCMRTREKPIMHIEAGHRVASLCVLGNIAYRLRRKLRWDPVAENVIGDEEANRMLAVPCRSPWRL